ncbi:MAG: outer membrane protein assembly factor BamE [Alphaproteobacteria bacterium]|nr:outer membrane protein assembly factor BamE [Alphaproteobacteria bacterium]
MTRLTRTVLLLFGAALVVLAATACDPRSATRGNIPTKEQISLVVPGVHGREDVRSVMGSPSVVSTFDDNTWYYIGRRTEQYAFFKRKTIEQQVLIVRYGTDGRVERISRLDESDGREIDLVERETPAAGRRLGLLEQLFGNIGRFSGEETGN